ncbi:MAG: glycosyltransferase family 4 protein [Fibrobacter sp.]|nr:glycosyltransferase family 4 protein [Fibrobacter sp.]
MKILVISSVYPRRDSDTEVPWLRESLKRLVRQGVKAEVLAPRWKGLKSHEIDGIKVHRFAYGPASWEVLTHDEGAPSKMASKPWMQLLAIPYIISGTWRCWRRCRKNPPQIIHAHWPFPHGLMAWPVAKLLSIPMVLNFHGAELLLIRKHPWVKWILRFLLGQSSGILCNSSFTKAKIQAIRDVPVEISPYGTTLQSIDFKKEQDLSKETFKVLFVGRHIERKGIFYLLKSAKILANKNIEFRIVGHGDQSETLRKYAQEKSLDKVHFLGKISSEDLQKEYENSHAFVLPAIVDSKGDTEGLGVVLIEAAEYNLSLIASSVGGIVDVVKNNETGLLVPEKDPQALAEAILKVYENPDLREKLTQGAKKHIGQYFSWENIIERQISFYNKVLNARLG